MLGIEIFEVRGLLSYSDPTVLTSLVELFNDSFDPAMSSEDILDPNWSPLAVTHDEDRVAQLMDASQAMDPSDDALFNNVRSTFRRGLRALINLLTVTLEPAASSLLARGRPRPLRV